MDKTPDIDEAVARALELGAEVESSGEAHTGEAAIARHRAQLHAWIDTVVGVVINAGLGRVTLIHSNGKQSGIASSELPFELSEPARFGEG
ncbi:MAG: hypothetical protein ABIW31_08555 [Novosphingobium sp.]